MGSSTSGSSERRNSMSWSIGAVGKAPAVAAKIAADIARIKCTEPEETIKNTVGDALARALAVMPPNMAVRVDAAGSQYAPDSTKPTEFQNSLSVKLEPLYGFVE